MRAALAILAMTVATASAHEAPTGWAYGWECCSGFDCRQLPQGAVATTPDGYLIKATGEVIGYGDKRLRTSRDGFYHQCTPGGDPAAKRSICLYAPGMGS